MLEGAVTYLQFVESILDAAKQNKKLQDRPPVARGSLFRPTCRPMY